MYTIDELERILSCTYPAAISEETKNKRKTNILAVQTLVRNAIEENDLRYGVSEERLLIFTTHASEKIYIQYPGKESTLEGAKRCPLDFRPRIMDADGHMLRDLVFADMWGAIENLNQQQHRMLKLMATIFFRMGRMLLHEATADEYICEVLDENENVIGHSSKTLEWFEFKVEEDLIEALNYNAAGLVIDDNITISLEAFLCFFELLLQNEDSKYFYKKGDLSSGRIPTSDSMLLLSSHLFGNTRLSTLLQRFVSGFGVAHCSVDEIEPATDGLVKIVNRKTEIINFFNDKGVVFRTSSYITKDGVKYPAAIKTSAPKVAVLSKDYDLNKDVLTELGWAVFSLDELVDQTAFDSFISLYETEQ